MTLFNETIEKAFQLIDSGQAEAGDLFYDWFCRTCALNRRGKKLIPKVKWVCNKLGLNLNEFTVTFANNCPMNGVLYDSFIIDSLDKKKRIYVTPEYGHFGELYLGCEVSVIRYDEDPSGLEKLNKAFKRWQIFKNGINNNPLKDEILQALNM